MSYLSVAKFSRYQHYKNRKPPWIKFYVDLLDPNNKLNYLPVEARFLFDRLLLLAAEWDNAIPNDFELIARLVVMQPRECRECLEMLLKGRWLVERKTKRRASKLASNPAIKLAPPEAEKEAETEREDALDALDARLNTQEGFDERVIEVDRILSLCGGVTPDSRSVVLFYARQVPLSSVVKVRESCRRKRGCKVGYAVNALKSEAKEAA